MKIGVFEAGLPNSGHDAGSSATIELCSLAQSMGHEVYYYYTGHNAWGRTDDLDQHGIAHHALPMHLADMTARWLAAQSLDMAILSRPGVGAQLLHHCQALQLPVIYFGHDIHHIRLARGNELLLDSQQVSTKDIAAMTLLEHHLWQQAACVIYPAQEEADMVNNYTSKGHGLALPLYDIDDVLNRYKHHTNHLTPSEDRTSILFVGGAHHQPNADAIQWFARDILAHITAPFSLSIVGDWPESLQQQITALWTRQARTTQTLTFTGRLDESALMHAYYCATLVIAPLRYGAGVKRKVVEALAIGKTVLTTPIGMEGIELPDDFTASLVAPMDGRIYGERLNAWLTDPPCTKKTTHLIRQLYSTAQRQRIMQKAFAFVTKPQ